MARTKQTRRSDMGEKSIYQRATFKPAKKPRKKRVPMTQRSWMTQHEIGAPWRYMPYRYDPWNSDPDFSDGDMGHDDLDDEVLFGSLRGNIVGIRYYSGIVNNNEMVALEREPHNKFDRNAIKVINVVRQQVGHIKRELASALAPIMDSGWARLEGVVPFGSQNQFSMPVDITLWGNPEHKQQTVSRLELQGIRMKVASDPVGPIAGTSSGISGQYGIVSNRRTFLTPAEVKNELDKLFETLSEGDKTSLMNPAQAISSTMYKHQKQALHWMIQRENGNQLPPFWENRHGSYYNSVTIFTTKEKPKSVCGGILADDMGLGKTLQTIALIVSNFKDGKPLAVPVLGRVRESKILRLKQKTEILEKQKNTPIKTKKSFVIKGNPEELVITPSKKRKTLCDMSQDKNILDDISDEDSTDTDEESDTEENGRENIMNKKDDPEFKIARELKIEKISSPIAGRRPRRMAKKPLRYTYSSDSDDCCKEIQSPLKKAKVETIDKENSVQIMSVGKGKTKGKGKGKQLLKKQNDKVFTKNYEDIVHNDQSCSVPDDHGQPDTDQKAVASQGENLPCQTGENQGKVQARSNGIKFCVCGTVLSSPGEITCSECLQQENASKGTTCPKLQDGGSPCGQALEKEYRFCLMCGWKIQEKIFLLGAKMCNAKTDEGKLCENVVAPPEKFCAHCGNKLSFTVQENTNQVSKPAVDRNVSSKPTVNRNDLLHPNVVGKVINQPNVKQTTFSGTSQSSLIQKKHEQTVESARIASSSYPLNPTAQPFVPGQQVKMTPRKMIATSISGDDLPDIPASCCSPGSSKCDEFSGRTPTTGARATLIVSPLSVLSNWLDQLEEHVHENVHLDVYTYYGANRIKSPGILSKQDIVLTTYSTLSNDAKNEKALQKVKWLRIVLDEGHAIRNPSAQQTKAICALQAERRWVLTGTPIQNSIKDLWSLINFLQISPFTDRQWWTRAIERPLEQGNESAIRRVQHLMGTIAMRRTKTQMVDGKPIVDLPERNVYVEHVKLSEEERSVYEAMQNEGKIIVSRYFQQGTLLHHYGDVLAILMRLRQMCCHPLLVAKAAAAMKDILSEAEPGCTLSDELRQKLVSTLLMVLNSGSDEECAICLDALRQPVITRCAHVFCRGCIEAVIKNEKPTARCPLCRGEVNAEKLLEVPPEQLQEKSVDPMPDDDWKSSTKVDALMNGLVKLRDESPGMKSLVVSQFTSLLTLLEIPLNANGFRFVRLDGTISIKQRIRAVEEFSNPANGSPTIMLLSLKAGGVGINLVAASRVFLMDPAWNPASEDQCFDRCHRLGQKKDVVITKFVVEDSVEERMIALQEQKRKLMQGAFGSKKQSAEEKRTNRIKDIKTLMDL